MGRTYFSAATFMRHREFEMWVPAYYQPCLPKELIEPDKTPLPKVNRFRAVGTRRHPGIMLRQTYDPGEMQKAFYSLEIALDLFQKNYVHQFVHDQDMVEILEGVDWYLTTIKADIVSGDEASIHFGKLVCRYRKELYKHYFRYMKTNTAALAELGPRTEQAKTLFSMLAAQRGTNPIMKSLDPLRERAKPPYDIDQLLHKEEAKAVTTSSVDASLEEFGCILGTSTNADDMLKDDGKDWNFSDFLGRQ